MIEYAKDFFALIGAVYVAALFYGAFAGWRDGARWREEDRAAQRWGEQWENDL